MRSSFTQEYINVTLLYARLQCTFLSEQDCDAMLFHTGVQQGDLPPHKGATRRSYSTQGCNAKRIMRTLHCESQLRMVTAQLNYNGVFLRTRMRQSDVFAIAAIEFGLGGEALGLDFLIRSSFTQGSCKVIFFYTSSQDVNMIFFRAILCEFPRFLSNRIDLSRSFLVVSGCQSRNCIIMSHEDIDNVLNILRF